ncbi:tRNA (adenosine(37)-N6)-threonylcarbamoyltransferase complex transferase subunit TsaD [Candidatus Micrarchaeota archaeon]|nr:tRNA (adenosine(37)-N6)-threonylcarbamoyltransferase complex transferase subunit TsaD [Candidatus Micrarchaeota archaeon]
MISLGVECTAHTFGVGLVEDGRVLSNERDVYKPALGSGIIPMEAAKHHDQVSGTILENALSKAGIGLGDVDVFSVSCGPGLPPCLLSGVRFAVRVAKGKPVVPVNHCVAHIEIGKLDSGCKDPLTLYVSGGNTQVMGLEKKRYRVFGETLDIGVGNALDKFGREVGLDNPAGPEVEKTAIGGRYVELPYTVKGMDLAFSGILTAALRRREKVALKDLCFSFQETVFSMLCEVTERALAHTGKLEVMVVGGVAQNRRLFGMLTDMSKAHGAKAYAPRPEWCGDNGAMIAYAGLLAFRHGSRERMEVQPRWRTDSVAINW